MERYFEACNQPQSNYALEHLVDGAQLTPERRFRQAVIELDVSQTKLRDSEYHRAMKNLELLELKADMENIEDLSSFAWKRLDLTKIKLENELKTLDRVIRGGRKEMNVHLNIVQRLQDEMGFDENTTSEEVETKIQDAEKDYYTLKLSLDLAADFVAKHGGGPPGVMLSLQHLPQEDINRVTALVSALVPRLMENKYTEALHSPDGVQKLEHRGHELQSIAKEKAKHEFTNPGRITRRG